MKRRKQMGFTLVELLVVISIIGMLAALLLPAVNSAREAGRKSVCVNNQRQVGLAIFQYETAKNEYPGYCMPQAVLLNPTTSAKEPSRPISWVFAILGRLERADIADNYGANAPKIGGSYPPAASGTGPYAAPNQLLNILVCPSDAQSSVPDPEGIADATSLSYAVNCGMKDEETNTAVAGTITMNALPAASQPYARDWAANGVFHYQFFYESVSGGGFSPTGEKPTKVTASSLTDGTSTTLILAENSDSGNWVDVLEQHVGFYWQGTLDGNGVPAPAASNEDWLVVDPTAATVVPTALLKINEQTGLVPATGDESYGRPASYHPGGVVVTYADAHTSFLNSDVDYLVYCLIMSPRGKYTLPAGSKGFDSMTGQQNLFLSLDPTMDARAQYARTTLSEDDL